MPGAALLALLAWLAVLAAGLGGSVGAWTQTLAGKLPAQAQHLQRLQGAAAATRAAQREAGQSLRTAQAVSHAAAAPPELTALAELWAGHVGPGKRPEVVAAPGAEPRPAHVPALPAGTRYTLPPGRAPPAHA